jgi:uncharacterized protein
MRRSQLRLPGRALPLCLALVALVVLAACGSGPGSSGTVGALTPPETPTPTEPHVPRMVVYFTTADHLKLDGWLYQEAARTALICAHGLAGDKSEWVDAAPWFAARGYMVLAFDFRGYSASQGPYNANQLDLDILAAIAFVKSRGAQEVLLLGSSLGAKVALRVASYTPVAGVIGLSPGYSNLAPARGDFELSKAVPRAVRAPKLFIDTQDDVFAGEMQQMYQEARPPKAMHLYPGDEHGINMFYTDFASDLINRILAFVATYASLR